MIVYFADRYFNILGQASTELPGGLTIADDRRVGDVESGVTVFEFTLPFNDKTRALAETCGDVGNYLLRSHKGVNDFYTIIDAEVDTKRQEVTVYAEDAGLELLNEIVGEYAADKAYPIEHYIEKFAYDSGFQIGENEAGGLTRKLSWDSDATAAERIASVAAQFDGCEISYSFEVEGLRVTKKLINVYKKRGIDAGVQLRLNRELDRIITKKSIVNLATALLPIGGTPEDAEVPIDLAGYEYDDGDIYLEGRYLKSRSALARWSRYLNPSEPLTTYTGHILKKYSSEALTQEALCTAAVAALKKAGEIEVNYEVELERLPDGVQLGDRVNIVDDAGALYMSARILKLEESVANRSTTATLGEYLIKSSGIAQKVADMATQFAEQAQAAASAWAAAQAAKAEAEAAKQQAEQAQTGAENAQTAANNATTVAGNAQETADAAEILAEAAQNAAGAAQNAANAAQTTANNAQTTANNAAKTATHFLYHDATNGLQVGNRSSGAWTGYRTQIKSDSFSVLDANGTTLSKFGANRIDLGNNGNETIISLCNGNLLISNATDPNLYTGTMSDIASNFLRLISPYCVIAKVEHDYKESNGTEYEVKDILQVGSAFEHGGMMIESSKWNNTADVSAGATTVYIGPDGITVATGQFNTDGVIMLASPTISLQGNVGIDGALETTGNAKIGGTLTTTGNAKIGGSATVGGKKVMTAADVQSGVWTPSCYAIGSPTQAVGYYTKVGNHCTISFCIYGTSSSSSTNNMSLRITGLPFAPDTSVKWFAGGGNISGANTPANYAFSGYSIEYNDTNGSMILPRCVAVSSNAGARSSNYCTNVSGNTIYMSGTIMYKVAT